jgi:hypothetical protein
MPAVTGTIRAMDMETAMVENSIITVSLVKRTMALFFTPSSHV